MATSRDANKEEAFQLEDIARRVEPRVSWEDLTLPQATLSQLKEIHRIFRGWGFARRHSHGKGLNLLFSGPPGSGETMAAEVIAFDLEMPFFIIDLGSVASKYIGETQKNLMKIFDSAETSNAILFFDEADALSGNQKQVSDAHDRYTNIVTGYLLQRMEEYMGIAIFDTNLRRGLDRAFVRRMRFVVEFPFPNHKPWDMVWRCFWRVLRKG